MSGVPTLYIHNASITHCKFVETRPRDNKFFKNKVKSDDYRLNWIVMPYSESYFEDTKYLFFKL